jgi:hypothetical protein
MVTLSADCFDSKNLDRFQQLLHRQRDVILQKTSRAEKDLRARQQ